MVGREIGAVEALCSGLLEEREDTRPAQTRGLEVEQKIEMTFDDGIEDSWFTGDGEVSGEASESGVEEIGVYPGTLPSPTYG